MIAPEKNYIDPTSYQAVNKQYKAQLKNIWKYGSDVEPAKIAKKYLLQFFLGSGVLAITLLIASFIMAVVSGGALTPIIVFLNVIKVPSLLLAYHAANPWLLVGLNVGFCMVAAFASFVAIKILYDLGRILSTAIQWLCDLAKTFVKKIEYKLLQNVLFVCGAVLYVPLHYFSAILFNLCDALDWAPRSRQQREDINGDSFSFSKLLSLTIRTLRERWWHYVSAAGFFSVAAAGVAIVLGCFNLSLLVLFLQSLPAQSLVIALQGMHPLFLVGIDLLLAVGAGYILVPATAMFCQLTYFLARSLAASCDEALNADGDPEGFERDDSNILWSLKNMLIHQSKWIISNLIKAILILVAPVAQIFLSVIRVMDFVGLLLMKPFRNTASTAYELSTVMMSTKKSEATPEEIDREDKRVRDLIGSCNVFRSAMLERLKNSPKALALNMITRDHTLLLANKVLIAIAKHFQATETLSKVDESLKEKVGMAYRQLSISQLQHFSSSILSSYNNKSDEVRRYLESLKCHLEEIKKGQQHPEDSNKIKEYIESIEGIQQHFGEMNKASQHIRTISRVWHYLEDIKTAQQHLEKLNKVMAYLEAAKKEKELFDRLQKTNKEILKTAIAECPEVFVVAAEQFILDFNAVAASLKFNDHSFNELLDKVAATAVEKYFKSLTAVSEHYSLLSTAASSVVETLPEQQIEDATANQEEVVEHITQSQTVGDDGSAAMMELTS